MNPLRFEAKPASYTVGAEDNVKFVDVWICNDDVTIHDYEELHEVTIPTVQAAFFICW